MKRLIIGLIIFFSFLLLFFIFNQISEKKIINYFEKKTEFEIILNSKSEWSFFPKFLYKNSDVVIINKKNLLKIKNGKIRITKDYWPTTPFYININSTASIYNGIEIRDLILDSKFSSNIFYINNLFGKFMDGNINLKGKFDFDDNKPFKIEGNFSNIPLNSVLNQLNISNWQRIKIKLSSKNFEIQGKTNESENVIKSLNGKIPIKGSFYFTTSDEERFGVAILSLLVEKFPSLTSINKSIDFVLLKYGDTPSTINGELLVNDGIISSQEIKITNQNATSIFKGNYNFLENTIDGKIFFYDNEVIILEASLKGSIENPKILVGGKIFEDNSDSESLDILELIEKGISSFIDKIIESND